MRFSHKKCGLIYRNISMVGILLILSVPMMSCGHNAAESRGGGRATIASITPSEVAVGDTLTISGSHFGESGSNTVVFIQKESEKLASPVEASSTQLKVVVPDAIGKAEVTVKVGKGNRAATPQGVTITERKRDQIAKEHVRDQNYQKGFKVTPLSTAIVKAGGGFDKTYVDTLAFGGDGSHPVWRLAQWGSDYSLEGAGPTEGDDGRIVYSNPGKKVGLYPDGSLLLEVDASREYDHPREDGESWPALLISQPLEDIISVGQVDKIKFSVKLKLVKAENKMAPEDYNPHIHTAHTIFYFIVRNKNPNSEDYNKVLNFGLRNYDYRHPNLNSFRPGLHGRDKGNNNYMYQMALDDMWGQITFTDRRWHRGEVDVKTHIQNALEALHNADAWTDTNMSDLRITRMSFNMEVPGTFNVAIKVKNISLKSITHEE